MTTTRKMTDDDMDDLVSEILGRIRGWTRSGGVGHRDNQCLDREWANGVAYNIAHSVRCWVEEWRPGERFTRIALGPAHSDTPLGILTSSVRGSLRYYRVTKRSDGRQVEVDEWAPQIVSAVLEAFADRGIVMSVRRTDDGSSHSTAIS